LAYFHGTGLFVKKLALVASVVALGFIGAAKAADMPTKAPVYKAPAAAPYNWTGFYIGAHVGYGFGVSKTSQPFDTDFLGGRGFVGGLLAGYNYMLTSRWLLGIEGDGSWSDLAHKGDFNDSAGDSFTVNVKQKQAYSVRARFGYLLAPETLLFATAGWSWAQFTYSLNSNFLGSESDSRWFNGPQVGAGIETMVASGWIARLEYLQSFYNAEAFNAPIINSFLGSPLETRPSIGIGRVALIYKFGQGNPSPWQAPVAAPSWNGFYAGGAIGAGIANAKIELVGGPPNAVDGIGIPGVFPTAMAGYDWRFAQHWVLSAEGEVAPGISTADFAVDWTAALRGRLGYLLTPTTMIYGSAGWVTTGIRTTSIVSDVVTIPSQRVNALELGAGVETAIDNHWLARFDYQFAFAGTINDVTFNVNAPFVTTGTVSAHPRFHYARLGLVYLFDN
jgi:outer membrane immunogenic protein